MMEHWIVLLGVMAGNTQEPFGDWRRDEAAIEKLISRKPVIVARTQVKSVTEQREQVLAEQRREAIKTEFVPGEFDGLVGERVDVYADGARKLTGIIERVHYNGVDLTVGPEGNQASFFISNERIRYVRLRNRP